MHSFFNTQQTEKENYCIHGVKMVTKMLLRVNVINLTKIPSSGNVIWISLFESFYFPLYVYLVNSWMKYCHLFSFSIKFTSWSLCPDCNYSFLFIECFYLILYFTLFNRSSFYFASQHFTLVQWYSTFVFLNTSLYFTSCNFVTFQRASPAWRQSTGQRLLLLFFLGSQWATRESKWQMWHHEMSPHVNIHRKLSLWEG